MFDFEAAEREERDRCRSVGDRIVAAIDALPAKNAETMAQAAYAVVREMSAEDGQTPDIETMIKGPDESHDYMGGTPGIWIVSWESGPYTWGISASMNICMSCGKLVETHYGFDLLFYPEED